MRKKLKETLHNEEAKEYSNITKPDWTRSQTYESTSSCIYKFAILSIEFDLYLQVKFFQR